MGVVNFYFVSKGKRYLVSLPAQDMNEGFGFPYWRCYLNGTAYESDTLEDLSAKIEKQAEIEGKVLGSFYQHNKPYIIKGVYA